MKSHKFNAESVAILSELYKELNEADDILENYSEEKNIENLNDDLDITDIIKYMEEFLAILKK
ncbi:hypothetical protein PB01_07520 [Psychrobacillus glaciei]|uniref:Uncharacterized protein n=1 Tax=Psychrobacillus glaciei TaxID=2283160 RepID=A0A5J6SML5_9BACI|nr:hypothetical protein [Psychrobacillus glaciei]QFF98693.1 hypothetical protein PB01_07520 [Psychrobacillus glaciei]